MRKITGKFRRPDSKKKGAELLLPTLFAMLLEPVRHAPSHALPSERSAVREARPG